MLISPKRHPEINSQPADESATGQKALENVTWTNRGRQEVGGTQTVSVYFLRGGMSLTKMAARSIAQGHGCFCEIRHPLPVPRARHDLMKSCLPLAGAAVFKISLKTHPRWPQAAHFLYQEHNTRPSWAGWSLWQGHALIDSKLASLGSSPPPLCCLGQAISLWSCSGPQHTSGSASRITGPVHTPGRCCRLGSAQLPSRWSSYGLSLARNKHLRSAGCSHLCILRVPHPVFPGQPT